MHIYICKPDSNNYTGIIRSTQKDLNPFLRFNGNKITKWNTSKVCYHIDDEDPHRSIKKIGDFPSLFSHVPVLSERALEALKHILKDHVQILPLQESQTKLYALNVLTISDCLDKEKSKILYFQSGGIMLIKKYVFRRKIDVPIFKVKGAELKEVLISEDFKNLVEKNRLRGLEFIKVG